MISMSPARELPEGQIRKRIPIIHDEATHRVSLKTLLKDESFECEVAEDEREALTIPRSENIDVILTDYNLPAMNGVEFSEQITQRTLPSHPACIVITGQLGTPFAEKAREAGTIATTHKPCDLGDLLDLIYEAPGSQFKPEKSMVQIEVGGDG